MAEVGGGGGGGGRRRTRAPLPSGGVGRGRNDDDCLRDTEDDDDEGGGEGDVGGGAAVVVGENKMAAAKSRRKGEEAVAKRRKKGERNVTKKSAVRSDIAIEGGDVGAGPPAHVGTTDDGEDASQRLRRTAIQVLPLRILAIDNRVLPTPAGDSMARSSFLGYIPLLVRGGLERGVLSSFSTASEAGVGGSTIVASLAYGTEEASRRGEEAIGRTGGGGASARASVVPRVSCLFESDDGKAASEDEQSSWLSDRLRPVNVELGKRDGADIDDAGIIGRNADRLFDPPRGFAAEDGWGCFGDLVEAVERKLSHSRGNTRGRARPITLFTTDANLFADAESPLHVIGLERFWERIRMAFDTNAVSTITIVIVETTSMMHMMKTIKTHHDSYDSASHLGDSGCTLDATSLPSRLHVMQCVTDIRRRINELDQSQYVQSTHLMTTPINLNLEFIEGNSISFQSLSQAWMNESFDQTYGSLWSGIVDGGASVRGRLSFDLPETLDGIMCSISLDLQYTVLPNCIHSPATKGLVEEMRLFSTLSSSSVEVVQTIPLSSVDSSLIFGVPMSARASFDTDICRYNEMKMLARQLWTYLSRNDVVLVLLVRLGSEEQLFLLACEDVVQKQPQALGHESKLDTDSFRIIPDKSRQGKSPCNGMLYRYATKSQLLRFGQERKRSEADEEDATDMSDYYLDYIERSLDTLVKTGLNPLLMGRTINS